MSFVIFKYVLTAAIIVAASEIAKRSDKLGALILAMPLMTLITLVWLHVENQPESKIANHAFYTFWYVIPTLPMFLVFPLLLRHFGFVIALLSLIGGSAALVLVSGLVLRKFGIDIL